MKIPETKIILASASPRRKELLNKLGLEFEVRKPEVDEDDYPDNIETNEIPVYLSRKKALSFKNKIQKDEVLIAADTIVALKDKVLGKPVDANDAKKILFKLSGNMHKVISGITIMGKGKISSFYEVTNVYFRELTIAEIDFYIREYKPFDKAGAYGIQEWIGLIGIPKIEGCFYNVMGLPVFRVYKELRAFGVS